MRVIQIFKLAGRVGNEYFWLSGSKDATGCLSLEESGFRGGRPNTAATNECVNSTQ
jgi:hypothetical protein